jgi:hypothetical protein
MHQLHCTGRHPSPLPSNVRPDDDTAEYDSDVLNSAASERRPGACRGGPIRRSGPPAGGRRRARGHWQFLVAAWSESEWQQLLSESVSLPVSGPRIDSVRVRARAESGTPMCQWPAREPDHWHPGPTGPGSQAAAARAMRQMPPSSSVFWPVT